MFVLGQLGKWILSLRSEILTARWQSDCSGLCGERRSGLLWATAAEERWAHLSGSKRGSERKQAEREFPGGLLVSIPGFHCHGLGSIPGRRTEIPQAEWLDKKKKKKKSEKEKKKKREYAERIVKRSWENKAMRRVWAVYSGLAIFAGRGWKTTSCVTVYVKLGMKHWSNYKPQRVLFYVAQGHFICCESMKAF